MSSLWFLGEFFMYLDDLIKSWKLKEVLKKVKEWIKECCLMFGYFQEYGAKAILKLTKLWLKDVKFNS